MVSTIRKWGNSLGLRIPKGLAEELVVADGSEVEILVAEGQLLIRPKRAPRFELADLLEKVTDDNLHEEVEIAPPRGREVW